MKEDTPSMTASAVATNPMPLSGKTWKMFKVPNEIFRRFENGRNKFERWSKYLQLEDETQREIYEYSKRYRENTVVLQCADTGALRAIRRKSSNGL